LFNEQNSPQPTANITNLTAAIKLLFIVQPSITSVSQIYLWLNAE